MRAGFYSTLGMSKKNPRPVPRFNTPIIETHCHLDYLNGDELLNVLDEARALGVERFVTIAVSPDNLAIVRALTEQSEHVWGTQGIHPHEADKWNAAVAADVLSGCKHSRIVAVGEIGLDYHYDHADRAAQRDAFEAQLELAIQCNMPVVIHTRDADDDTRDILANHSARMRKKGVIHSFTSGLPLAEYCLSEGFYLGFNGITTFNRADNVRDVVRATPIQQLVLETDSPYLTPVPYRGRVNTPRYLPLIAEKVAQLKTLEVEALLKIVHANSHALFFEEA